MVEMLHRTTEADVKPGAAARVRESPAACPLCGSDSQTYLFFRQGARVSRCVNCRLTRLSAQLAGSEIHAFYENTIGHKSYTDDSQMASSLTEREAAKAYLEVLRMRKAVGSRLLLVAAKGHPFAAMAGSCDLKIETSLDVRELERAVLPDAYYDSAALIFQLEKATNPVKLLQQIHASLKPGGLIFVVTPSLDSWSAKFFRGQWTEWRPENYYYFDSQTIQSVLLKSGFAQVEVARDRRRYSLQHLYSRASNSPRTLLTRLVRLICYPTPGFLRRNLRLKLPTSGILVTARRAERGPRPLLSIIVPAYNESATLAATMNSILAKDVPEVDKEIIVVESNSTDGTRDIALAYRDCPGVRVILEDRPKGKGSAVRIGLKQARGDLILIQDADQEYDINDYDALIEPLQTYRRAFVLGSRHVKGWKIRKFNDQPGVTAFFNFGHVLFAGLLNLIYGQRIKDPFTMYKVFRRDCLHGLKFECDRFDFDFELVIKLLRKGYTPLEIPVNYEARSFKEGKKVSVLRDPLTWVRALMKYRFVSIYIDPARSKQPGGGASTDGGNTCTRS